MSSSFPERISCDQSVSLFITQFRPISFSARGCPLTSKSVTLGYYWDTSSSESNGDSDFTSSLTENSLARRWENMFHVSTREYYTKVSNESLATGSVEDYINMVSLSIETLVYRTRRRCLLKTSRLIEAW